MWIPHCGKANSDLDFSGQYYHSSELRHGERERDGETDIRKCIGREVDKILPADHVIVLVHIEFGQHGGASMAINIFLFSSLTSLTLFVSFSKL